MSFDKILDLTAGVYFNFYNIYIRSREGAKEPAYRYTVALDLIHV